MNRICVDMDEVLADALGKLIRLYNAEFSEDLTVDDMWGKWMVNVLPASRQEFGGATWAVNMWTPSLWRAVERSSRLPALSSMSNRSAKLKC